MSKVIHYLQRNDAEIEAYRQLSAGVKFKQNLVQGIGAALVFGIAAAGGKALLDVLATSSIATATGAFAFAAVGGIVAVGVGCLYLASKFYAESVRLDQTYQAKQIANGIKDVTPTIEQQKPMSFPEAAASVTTASLDKPAVDAMTPQVSVMDERALDGRVAAPQLEQAKA